MNELTGTLVIVKNGDIDAAIRIFKKKMKKSSKLYLYQESLHYQKPSEKKRKKRLRAKIRRMKEQGIFKEREVKNEIP